jgi:cell division protein FtsB
MRLLALAFVALIAAIQYPLWLGKGGWLRTWDLDRQLAAQRTHNAQLQARNDALEAEVLDLKSGYEAIEERARFELGMIRQDEAWFQFVKPESLGTPAPPPAPVVPPSASGKGASPAR